VRALLAPNAVGETKTHGNSMVAPFVAHNFSSPAQGALISVKSAPEGPADGFRLLGQENMFDPTIERIGPARNTLSCKIDRSQLRLPYLLRRAAPLDRPLLESPCIDLI
jgi:hypothetical protein